MLHGKPLGRQIGRLMIRRQSKGQRPGSWADYRVWRVAVFSLLVVLVLVAVTFDRERHAAAGAVASGRAFPEPLKSESKTKQNTPRLHLYVHYDYMVNPDGTNDAPDPDAIDLVRQAFDAHGIDLVIDSHHAAIPFWSLVNFGGDVGSCAPPDSIIAFDTLKAQYFHPTSAHEWHYAIFGERYDCSGSTGIAWLPGDDFFISLGQDRAIFSRLPRERVIRWEAGTFMHELGHNLGLDHGGQSSVNYKPNYLSVMNYSFQTTGIPYASALGSRVPVGFRIDYSEQALPNLDELHLNETLGIQAGTTDITFFNGEFGFGLGSGTGPIDWNLNGDATEPDVAVDLNRDFNHFTLTGFDDWTFVLNVLSGKTPRGPRRLPDENRAHEPFVGSLEPASGSSLGGTVVTIHGMHFDKVDRVFFGNVPAPTFRILDVQTIVAVSPPGSDTVRVMVGSGPNLSPYSTELFTYLRPVISDITPHQGPPGTVITIRGERLGTTRSVSFVGDNVIPGPSVSAISFSVVDDNTLSVTAQTPTCLTDRNCAFGNGPHVVVTTDAYGTSEIPTNCCGDLFFAPYFFFTSDPRPVPTVTSVSPSIGLANGQTFVVIKGTGFRFLDERGIDQPNVNWVSFGNVGTSNISLWDSNTIICNAPSGGSGTVDVQVWNVVGKSPFSTADRFTYLESDPAQGLYLNQFALPFTITPANANSAYPVGNYITYALNVTNPLPTDAASVLVTDNLPPETTLWFCFPGSSGVCGGAGNSRTISFSSIPGFGSVAGANLVVRINDGVAAGTAITNTAMVTSSSPDPDLSDNSATTTIIAGASPSASNRIPQATGGLLSAAVAEGNHRQGLLELLVYQSRFDQCALVDPQGTRSWPTCHSLRFP